MTSATASSRDRRRQVFWGSALFVGALFLQCAGSFAAEDEAWFVQVVRRVLEGDVLYRDVAFGLNPLSVYATVPFAAVFGAELLVVKVLQSIVFAATVLVAIRIAERLGLRGFLAELGLVAGFFACAPAGSTISFYTPLSMLFVVCALADVLAWIDGETHGRVHRITRAGIWVGAAFATKQNVGVLAFLAVAAVLVLVAFLGARMPASRPWRDLVRLTVAFAVVVGIVLIPVAATGAFPGFIDFAYLGKTTYLRVAGVDPLLTIREWTRGLAGAGSLSGLSAFLTQQAAIVPILGFGGLVGLAPVWWRSDRLRTLAILVCAVAGFAAAFPRSDYAHLAGSIPVLLIAVVQAVSVAGTSISQSSRRAVCVVIVAVAVGGTASRFGAAIVNVASAEYRVSHLAGLRGVMAPNAFLDDISRETADLDRILAGRDRVFLLSPRAGMYSLVSRRTNPTPFDYPFVTTLGSAGEDGLIGMLDSGRIRYVCIDLSGQEAGPLWPARFEEEVRRRGRRIEASGGWELYGVEP